VPPAADAAAFAGTEMDVATARMATARATRVDRGRRSEPTRTNTALPDIGLPESELL
jgi:hypothetical protein